MSFANRDGRQPIEESVHRLSARLRRRVGRVTGHDDRAVATATAEASRADELPESADETDGGGRAERGPVVLIDLIAEARVADLVQSGMLVEAGGAAVREHQTGGRD